MAPAYGQHQFVLPASLEGTAGVERVAPLLNMSDGDLSIDARALRRIDSMCAVVVRAAVERFTGRQAPNRVWISLPRDEHVCPLLTRLLGDVPRDLDYWDPPPARLRPTHPRVLLPAHRVHDNERRSEVQALLRAAEDRFTGRGRVRPGALLLSSFGELLQNGVTHGGDSDVDVICAACATSERDLQIAVFDTAPHAASAPDGAETLRRHVEHSQAKPGGFYGMIVSARYPSTLRLMTANATLIWNAGVRVELRSEHLGGYLAVLDVHL